MGLRKQAIIAGETTYFTGKPCINGHVAVRFTLNGSCRVCANKKCAEWGEKNKERRLEYYKKYRDGNRELLRARGADYRQRNPEKIAQKQRKWNQANKEKRCVYARETAHKRRAYKANVISDLTRDQIQNIVDMQKGKCAFCKKSTKLTVDHIVPLSKGGENSKRNIQMLCGPCNMSKGAKLPEEFARKRGMLI